MCGGQWESLARSSGALETKGRRNALCGHIFAKVYLGQTTASKWAESRGSWPGAGS